MAEREMEQVKVYIGEEGHVCIAQLDVIEQCDKIVILHPAQIGPLIQWLQEIKAELSSKIEA